MLSAADMRGRADMGRRAHPWSGVKLRRADMRRCADLRRRDVRSTATTAATTEMRRTTAAAASAAKMRCAATAARRRTAAVLVLGQGRTAGQQRDNSRRTE